MPAKQKAKPDKPTIKSNRSYIMRTSKLATIAFLVAALGSGYAAAAGTAPQSVSRAQVLAELAEAQRTGDIVDGKTDKKLNELYPSLYPAKAAVQGKTREQVLAELTEARRTGDIVDGKTDKKLNELYPNLYPAKVAAHGVTREQVLAELSEAQRTGDIVDGKTSKKLNELYPHLYSSQS